MHNSSHPEHDKEMDTVDQTLREQLRALRDLPNWSNNKLAKSLGCNSAYIQQFIDDKFPGDIAAFERKLRDFFANEARRRASGVETTECQSTKQIHAAFEIIRKTNDFGTIVAVSGEGKTRGIESYVEANPTCILHRTTAWSNDKQSVEAALFENVGRAGYSGNTKRALFLVDKLRGSNRFIIVDDAHKLTRPALQWFYDFHDATQIPVCLTGMLELIAKLEDDTQRFSRTGYYEEIKSIDAKGNLIVDRALIRHLVKQLVPEANGETDTLCDLSEQVAEKNGHYRSVHKQLKLAVEIKSGASKLTWDQAFRAAHTRLIRNYKLN
jgi:hypothetical protein